MLRQISTLQRLSIRAAEGGIGKVCDVYLDPRIWTVKYLVVDTLGDLPARYALISPDAVAAIDWHEQVVQLRIERRLIEESSVMDIPRPLYWSDHTLSGGATGTHEQQPCHLLHQGRDECDPMTLAMLRPPGRTQPSLHSAAALAVLQAEGIDGSLGQVIDSLYDERTWTLRYLLLDTMCLVPESHLLISTRWIEKVSTPLGAVYTFLSRNAVRTELESAVAVG